MSFGPTVTALTAAQVDGTTLSPCSKASARNEVPFSDILAAAMANSTASALTITQAVAATGSPTFLLFTGAAHTTLTTSVEAPDINFNLARTVQFATGAIAAQRAFRIQAPTYGFVGASTITEAATLSVEGRPLAGTNATITRGYAAVISGLSAFRQVGGTGGTDEIQVSHDGTQGVIECKDGLLSLIATATAVLFSVSAGSRLVVKDRAGGGDSLTQGASGIYGFVSGGAVGVNNNHDSGIVRVAAGVVAANADSTNAGWIQSPAGRKRTTTQFDATTTTLGTVGGLSTTVAAGRTYYFVASLPVTADAVGGYKVAIAGTATATAIQYDIVVEANGVAPSLSRQSALAGSAGGILGTTVRIWVEGTITVNAGGTLLVQFSQNAANGTSSVLVGATFVLEDMP